MDERISEEKPVDPEVRHASAIHENEVSLGVIESIGEVASHFTTDGGNVRDESDSAANVGGENPIPNESSLQDTEVTEVAEELNVEHTANAENEGHSQKIASQEDENKRADLFAAAGTIEMFLPTAITAPCIPAGTPSNSCGEIIVPAQVDNVQEQILSALQILKVIDADVKPGDICTRREYARWLMTASAVLTKSPAHKVIPAMFIENSSVLAYDDVTPQDPDFPAIQGLAEAGLLSSRLIDEEHVVKEKNFDVFSPDSPLTRQDLVSWKIALERKSAALDRDVTSTTFMALQDKFGFIDLEKVHKDAWPALLMDISAGEQSIIALTFGRTRRLQPLKPVTKGQAAVALATGEAWELVSEELARLEAESVAEAAVVAELALEAKAQKEAATVFENLVQEEKEKQQASASMLESTRAELEQIRDLFEGEKSGLIKERAALDAEKDLLTITRHEVEQQALDLCSAKMEVAFQLEQASKLRSEAEEERASISKLRKELEIEKNALILARSWAEDEARTAEEFSRKLEQWGNRLKDQDFNVNVGHEPDFIRLQQNTGTEAAVVSENGPSDESYEKIEEQNQSSTMDALIGKSREFGRVLMDAFVRLLKFLQELLHEIKVFITVLLERAGGRFHEARIRCVEGTTRTMEGLKQTVPSSVAGLTSSLKEGTLKAIDEWKEGAEKLSQKFKAP
ncbi:hypothetical protein KP509_10G025100 [Ceratopteris richardii]|nr:hypothetical protein KP509_10G025100 [Ceratopteris richardii]